MIMNSTETSFKNALLTILAKINESEQHKRDVFAESVDEKLDRSFQNYEKELEETCKYILSKNPVKVIKEINRINKKKEKEEEEQDEDL